MCEKSPDGADSCGLLFVCLIVFLSIRTLAKKKVGGKTHRREEKVEKKGRERRGLSLRPRRYFFA